MLASVVSVFRRLDECERLSRAEDIDALELFEDQQVLVAGDDEGGFGGERTGKHVIIIGIAAHGGDGEDAHESGQGAIACEHGGGRAADRADAGGVFVAREDVFQFGQQRGAGEERDPLSARGAQDFSG